MGLNWSDLDSCDASILVMQVRAYRLLTDLLSICDAIVLKFHHMFNTIFYMKNSSPSHSYFPMVSISWKKGLGID